MPEDSRPGGSWPGFLQEHPIVAPGQDKLDFRPPAEALARSLLARAPLASSRGFVVSLEGDFGSGKSSFANLLRAELHKAQMDHAGRIAPSSLDERSPDVIENPLEAEERYAPILVPLNVAQIESHKVSLWSVLALRIGRELYHDLHRRLQRWRLTPIASPHDIRMGTPNPALIQVLRPPSELGGRGNIVGDPSAGPLLLDQRVHWTQVARLLSLDLDPREHWDPCLNLYADAPSKLPRQGLEQAEFLSMLTEGILASVKAAFGTRGAVSAANDAKNLLERLIAGRELPATEIEFDSDEFAGELGILLRAIKYEAAPYRAVVILEDIGRASDEVQKQLPVLLSHLRRVPGLLAIATFDPAALKLLEGNVVPSARTPDRQGLLRYLDLRWRVPRPGPRALGRLAASLVEALPFQGGDISLELARLAGVFSEPPGTPREVKGRLRWLWAALILNDGLALEEDDPGLLAWIAESPTERFVPCAQLLLTSKDFALGQVDEAALLDAARSGSGFLTRFPRRPWDHGIWGDGLAAVLPSLDKLPAHWEITATVESLRLLELATAVIPASSTEDEKDPPSYLRALEDAEGAARRFLDNSADITETLLAPMEKQQRQAVRELPRLVLNGVSALPRLAVALTQASLWPNPTISEVNPDWLARHSLSVDYLAVALRAQEVLPEHRARAAWLLASLHPVGFLSMKMNRPGDFAVGSADDQRSADERARWLLSVLGQPGAGEGP